jgi:hypothetical protein
MRLEEKVRGEESPRSEARNPSDEKNLRIRNSEPGARNSGTFQPICDENNFRLIFLALGS